MSNVLFALGQARALVRRALRTLARATTAATRIVRLEIATYQLRRVVRLALEEQRAARIPRARSRSFRPRPHPAAARAPSTQASPPPGPVLSAPVCGARGEPRP